MDLHDPPPMFVFVCFSLGMVLLKKCSLHICEIVFHFSLWFKLSTFFQLGPIFCWNPHKRGKNSTWKKLNVDRQFFNGVICIFYDVTLCDLIGESCYSFHPFSFIITSLPTSPNEDFYTFPLPLFIIRLETLSHPPASLLVHHIFSWKKKQTQAYWGRYYVLPFNEQNLH